MEKFTFFHGNILRSVMQMNESEMLTRIHCPASFLFSTKITHTIDKLYTPKGKIRTGFLNTKREINKAWFLFTSQLLQQSGNSSRDMAYWSLVTREFTVSAQEIFYGWSITTK